MRNHLKITKTEETFNLLGKHIPNYNPTRSMEVIVLKLRKPDECKAFTRQIKHNIMDAENDLEKIEELKLHYNSEYSSNNPKCLSTPHLIYNEVHTFLQDLRDNINKLKPREKRGANLQLSNEQIMDRSLLFGSQPYSPDMFPDDFPKYIKELQKELGKYISIAKNIIDSCKELIDEESRIRQDDKFCKELFLEEKAEIEQELEWLRGRFQPTDEDMERYRKSFQGENAYSRDFHTKTKNELKVLTLCGKYEEAKKNGLNNEESQIWSDEDHDFVKDKVRKVLRNMKNCKELPMTKMRNSEERALRAEFLACLTVWCRANAKGQTRHFLNYLRSTFQNTNLHLPKDSAVYEKLRCGKNECYNWKEYMEIIENLSI